MAKAVFSARTPQELQRLSEEQGIRTTLQLTAHERSNSASRWTFRHLIAFRLLTNPERKYLETFGSTHSKECPVCNSADDCSQQVDYEMTRAFTRESCPLDLLTSTESDLMRLENGSFWVALARASRPDVFNEGKMYPQRERRDMERADYMNSTTAIVGSSSPTRPSSSEFEVGMEDIDEDDHDARRSKPEEVTVQLVTSFLQHSLYFCLLQRSDETEVRVRVERRRAEMYVNGIDQAVAEDDGGICRMERQALGWLRNQTNRVK
ncbi:hypothetical protein V2G26_018295 [Clonostachys chloroleuca]